MFVTKKRTRDNKSVSSEFEAGALEPVLEPWWPRFSGPFLYYPGRRLVPAPLRAFIDFVKAGAAAQAISRQPAMASSSMASA